MVMQPHVILHVIKVTLKTCSSVVLLAIFQVILTIANVSSCHLTKHTNHLSRST